MDDQANRAIMLPGLVIAAPTHPPIIQDAGDENVQNAVAPGFPGPAPEHNGNENPIPSPDSWSRMLAESNEREISLRKEYAAYKESTEKKISSLMDEIQELKKLLDKQGK